MARLSKYTPQLVAEIIGAIETGASDVDACVLAGISQDTFYTWLKDKPEFSEQVTRARVLCKHALVERVRDSGKGKLGDWRANAWLLERKWPQEYAQQLIVKVSAEDAALLKANKMTASEAWQLLMTELASAEVQK